MSNKKCPECDARFATGREVKDHVRAEHSEEAHVWMSDRISTTHPEQRPMVDVLHEKVAAQAARLTALEAALDRFSDAVSELLMVLPRDIAPSNVAALLDEIELEGCSCTSAALQGEAPQCRIHKLVDRLRTRPIGEVPSREPLDAP